jgi:predicted RNA-binding Zn-ribbon protein involved in translation (DUF1610 family)
MRISDEKPYFVILEHQHEFMELEENCFGLCIACGEESGRIEPDASHYECDNCGERKVYGTANLLMMNRVVFE